ncbi:helix-turn-helix transcriptional regulator [Nocardioides sp.]|uniref:helix-turn-helix domain-containing protein n=1 Tax=Nocardioides sp. TaxID=35761 RepID=UPI0026358AA4|nr:helix-turn-helix transcriptional regulator [Nocardioides sp.]
METGLRGRVAEVVRESLATSDLTLREVSARSGVSTSTIGRILTGQTAATLDTLDDLLAAVGRTATVTASTATTLGAAAAARFLLNGEDALAEVAGPWTDRLTAWATTPTGLDPIAVLTEAGQAAAPDRLPGAVHLAPGAVTLGRIASAASTDGGPWALSGRAGLPAAAASFDAPVPDQTVVWVRDPHGVRRHLADLDTAPAHRAAIVLAPAPDWLFAAGHEAAHLNYVTPMQTAIDCLGLGGTAADETRAWLTTWT